MRRSRLLAIVTCLVGVLVLTGCSPAVLGFAGIERVGNDFRVVVVMCEGNSIDRVQIRDRSQVSESEYVVVHEIPVSESGQLLTSEVLPQEHAFQVLFAARNNLLGGKVPGLFPIVVAGVWFTKDDLLALGEGEVLIPDPTTVDEMTVEGVDDFIQLIQEEWCDPARF